MQYVIGSIFSRATTAHCTLIIFLVYPMGIEQSVEKIAEIQQGVFHLRFFSAVQLRS
jgi:hypothetical protein